MAANVKSITCAAKTAQNCKKPLRVAEVGLIALQAFAIIMTGATGIIQPAQAVLSGDMSPKARSGDADYADGMDAWDVKN
jgi:hypothetical protein